ncbi:MAG: hypothetical protein EAZ62_04415 [Sphingobacteriia bacterium]|nr:MAG: hypothetical protein EAZ62_04415 [Sphingobacteriia bacterium]
MKAKLLMILTCGSIFYGCTKSNFTTKPKLEFGSASSTVLTQGQIITFTLDFTDKEGDIQDSLWVQKISRTCPTTPGVQFVSKNAIPNFTATPNLKGKMEIRFVYNANVSGIQSIVGCTNRNDTSIFKFWMKDRAQNRSDTVSSPEIVLIR